MWLLPLTYLSTSYNFPWSSSSSSSSNSMSRYKQEQPPRERRSIHHSPPPQRHGKDFLKKKVHLPTSIPWYSSKDNDNKAPEKPPRPQYFSLSLSLSLSRTMKEYLSFSCQEGAYLPLPPPMIEEVRKAAAPREDERRAREQRREKRERQSLSTTYLPNYLHSISLAPTPPSCLT